MRIKAFKALRPPADRADTVAAVPYDTVDTAEARALAAGNPVSFLHVSRPEIDCPDGTDIYADAVYEGARETFSRFRSEGVLAPDDTACLYVYRMISGDHTQTGLVACCHVDDTVNGIIKKHENTRVDKENDRVRHMQMLEANPSPVFLAYEDQADVDRLVADIESSSPMFDFTAPDGVRHTVWGVSDPGALLNAFDAIPEAYIADGHHRSASALRARNARRDDDPGLSPDDECHWFMVILFPAGQLRILPYNRSVEDLNGLSPDAFLAAVKERFTVTAGGGPTPPGPQHSSMYIGGAWYDLSWECPDDGDPASMLDVSVLQDRLLGPVLGILEPREDMRLRFIGGNKGSDELVRRVESGEAAAAFSMFPVDVRQIMKVADAGLTMPPKSTWFAPKPRSGLLVHTF